MKFWSKGRSWSAMVRLLGGIVVLGGSSASVCLAQPTAQFQPEISTAYPFDAARSGASHAPGPQPARTSRPNPPRSPKVKPPTQASELTMASVPLVRVPWAELPQTVAAAQQDLAWRATLPSSGIAAWGINPVQNPERALAEVLVGGGVVGVGVVLEGGAVLTSLTVIGRGLDVELRFADGTLDQAAVRRTHRAYDLALLQPAGNLVRAGLPLARAVSGTLGLLYRGGSAAEDARSAPPSTGPDARRAPLGRNRIREVAVEWFGATWGSDGVPIHAALRPPQLTEIGTPLVNVSGHLAGLVTLACVADSPRSSAESHGCRLTRVGLTSGTLGEFLGVVESDVSQVWFGVLGENTDTGWARGIRVTGVTPDSPAAHAGVKPVGMAGAGDVIVAIDNTPVYEMEHLRRVLKAQRPGAQPLLTILRGGRLIQLPVKLPVSVVPLPLAETPEPWVSF